METTEKSRKALPLRRREKYLLAIMAVLALIAVVCCLIIRQDVVKSINLQWEEMEQALIRCVSLEAGDPAPGVNDFLKTERNDAALLLPENFDTLHVGNHEATVNLSGHSFPVVIHVEDTIAPTLTAQDQTTFAGEALTADNFVAEVHDTTDVSVRFLTEPDFQKEGKQTVTLIATDAGGNTAEASAELEILVDREPPVIRGVKKITITLGSNVSYKKDVTVTDNYDENVKLEVDTSAVDLTKVGKYPITYIATDRFGNTTKVSTKLKIKAATLATATEDTINALADGILASIIKDGMTQYEQIEAVFNWCHSKIKYVDHTPKISYVDGAFRGLSQRAGDCFTYAMTAKCFLNRLGIPNLDIKRIDGYPSQHFWNLVDIGEGWYHYDTCRHADGFAGFYKTDEEVAAYTKKHPGAYHYDPALYPEIQ